MAHFLINRHMGVYAARGGQMMILHIFGQTQQDAYRQLIVQEAALDITGGRHAGAGLKADDIAHLNAQLTRILGGFHILVQHHFGGVEITLGIAIFGVYMDGRVAQLQRAFDHLAGAGIYAHVFGFAVFGAHAAQIGYAQAAVALDFSHHCAQGVGVGFQQQCVLRILPAQINQHAALTGDVRGIA